VRLPQTFGAARGLKRAGRHREGLPARRVPAPHLRVHLSNAMYSQPLSFQSLRSEDVEGDPPRIEVTATLRTHPKDQARLELMASRISMEKSVSSVSWSAKEAELTPE